jgi:hypothetical protein
MRIFQVHDPSTYVLITYGRNFLVYQKIKYTIAITQLTPQQRDNIAYKYKNLKYSLDNIYILTYSWS